MASTESETYYRNGSGDAPSPTHTSSKLKDSKYSWFVCACGFITQVFIVGVLHAFGVFFVEFIKDFNSTKAKAAWVGSVAYGLSMTFGPFTSMLINRFGNRAVMVSGGVICAASVFGTSFVETLPQMFGSFSVFYGIGTCMASSPTMTIAPAYFEKQTAVALGIMTAGSSVGTLVMAPLSQILIDRIGWRNTFRFFTGTCLFSALCCSFIIPLETDTKPTTASCTKFSLLSIAQDLRLWKNRVFIVWTLAITCVMFGFYIPYVHLVSYAVELGISPEKGSMIVMLLGACTAVGRLSFGKIVQLGILNRLHMHQASMVITGTGMMLLPLIKSFEGIIVYVVIVGLVDGCFVVLLPVLTTTFIGIKDTVIAWGFLVGVASITFTMGPPIAGAISDVLGSYNVAFHCAGIPVILGAVILFLIPWAQRTSATPSLSLIASDEKIRNEYDLMDDILFGPRESMERVHSRSSSLHTINSEHENSSVIPGTDSSSRIPTPTRPHRASKYKATRDQSTATSQGPGIFVPLDAQHSLKLLNDNYARQTLSDIVGEIVKSRSALVQSQYPFEENPRNVASIMSAPCWVPDTRNRTYYQNMNDFYNTHQQSSFGQENHMSIDSSIQSRNLSDFICQIESPSHLSDIQIGHISSVSRCESSKGQRSIPVLPNGCIGVSPSENQPGLLHHQPEHNEHIELVELENIIESEMKSLQNPKISNDVFTNNIPHDESNDESSCEQTVSEYRGCDFSMEHWLDNSPNEPLPSEFFRTDVSPKSPSDGDFNDDSDKDAEYNGQDVDIYSSESRQSCELDVFTHLFDDNGNLD